MKKNTWQNWRVGNELPGLNEHVLIWSKNLKGGWEKAAFQGEHFSLLSGIHQGTVLSIHCVSHWMKITGPYENEK